MSYLTLAEEKKKYRFAEQLDEAALSISNNIAKDSDSFQIKSLRDNLSIAGKYLYEYEMRMTIGYEQRFAIPD